MLKIITATEIDKLNTRTFVIGLDVYDENINIEQAIKNACTEYCLTKEGKSTYKNNCNCFNWGDFGTYVPNEICERHGFKKVRLNIAPEFNFDQQLVDEDALLEDEEPILKR